MNEGSTMDDQIAGLVCPHIALRGGALTLLGSRCAACAEVYFPPAGNCTRCLSRDLRPHDLGGRGTLWSWTVQSFMPKPPYDGGEAPEQFRPYGVGYVEMADGIKVEARLTQAEGLRIGMAMKLVLADYGAPGRPGALRTYAFEPETEA